MRGSESAEHKIAKIRYGSNGRLVEPTSAKKR